MCADNCAMLGTSVYLYNADAPERLLAHSEFHSILNPFFRIAPIFFNCFTRLVVFSKAIQPIRVGIAI